MPQDVEFGGLREHPIDAAAVYEITLRGTPPAGLTARFPSMTLHSGLRDDWVSRFCDPCGGRPGSSRSARWCGSLPRPGTCS